MQNQYLYHYGVKGMRWGVRKERRKASRQLYKDVKESAKHHNYYDGGDKLMRKHRGAFEDAVKKSSDVWTKALDGTLDYTKGSPDYQSVNLARSKGKELLGSYSNRKIHLLNGSKMSSSEYVALVIDRFGSFRAADIIEIREGRKPKLGVYDGN